MPKSKASKNDALSNQNLQHLQQQSTKNMSSVAEKTIDRILESIEKRKQATMTTKNTSSSPSILELSTTTPNPTYGGPLLMNELNQLSMISTSSGWTFSSKEDKENIESLIQLCQVLEIHVNSAKCIDLVGELVNLFVDKGIQYDEGDEGDDGVCLEDIEIWLKTIYPKKLAILCCGIDAASNLLSIMSIPNIPDRRLINEDIISGIIDLFKNLLLKNIIPAISNQSGYFMYTTAMAKKKKGKQQNDTISSSKGTKTQKKKKNTKQKKESSSSSPNNSTATLLSSQIQEELKKIYKPILMQTIGQITVLMERIDSFLSSSGIQLDDSPILSLTFSTLKTFGICDSHNQEKNIIQMCSLSILQTIFKRYRNHRMIVMEDLFPLLLKIPQNKKQMRSFPVFLGNNKSSNTTMTMMIQPISALILAFVQASVTMPVSLLQKDQDESKKKKKAKKRKRKNDDDDDDYNDNDQSNQDNPPQNNAQRKSTSKNEGGYSDGLSDAKNVCDFFARNLLARCARKGEDGGASEFRPILSNLIDDFLQVMLLPEYPGADLVLTFIARHISHSLLSSPKKGKKGLEPTYISTAMDTLGKICSHTSKCIQEQKESPMVLKAKEKEASSSNPSEPKPQKCFCGRLNLTNTFMLDCDRCHDWFHGSCVNVTKDNLPYVWICEDCQMQLVIEEQFVKKLEGGRGSSSVKFEGEIEDIHVFRQLVLNHFSSSALSSAGIQNAREFHIAKWLQHHQLQQQQTSSNKNDNDKDKTIHNDFFLTTHYLDQWDPFNSTSSNNPQQLLRLETKTQKLMLTLAVKTPHDLFQTYPQILGVMVKLMSDPTCVLHRKISTKAITQVISHDPNLMIQPLIRKAVSERFQDESISVREAVVSLVGSLVSSPSHSNIAEQFHNCLLYALSDKGVSVRKRAIKIFHDILKRGDSPKRAQVLSKLLRIASNPKEEDTGVRELIYDTFYDLWFRFSPDNNDSVDAAGVNERKKRRKIGHDGKRVSISEEDIITSSLAASGTTEEGTRRKIHNTSHDIVDVVVSLGSTDFLVGLIKDLISPSSFGSDKDNKSKKGGKGAQAQAHRLLRKRQEEMNVHCTNLINALMEQLLIFEEQRSAKSSNNKATSNNSETDAKRLVAIISTLRAFGESSGSINTDTSSSILSISSHMDQIIPYLKADNNLSRENEQIIIFEICQLLTQIIPFLGRVELKHLSGIANDLEKVIYTFGTLTLGKAVEVLANLAIAWDDKKESSDENSENLAKKKLLKLATTFYTYLYKIQSTKQQKRNLTQGLTQGVRNNIHRALSALGSICRYFDSFLMMEGGTPKNSEEETLEYYELVFDQNTPTSISIKPSELNAHTLFNASLACILLFLSSGGSTDVSTKCCALRALTGLFIARPRAMLSAEESGMIQALMSGDQNSNSEQQDQFHHQILICWKEILLAEEHRIQSGEAKAKMDSQSTEITGTTSVSVSKKISGDQDGDSTLCGGIMTQHCPQLFQFMTYGKNHLIRLEGVDLVGHLLRQGLINPMDAVPHLLSLQGDVEAPPVKEMALKLLIMEGEKRPDMLRQRICAGVRQAFTFQRCLLKSKNKKRVTALILQPKKANGTSASDSTEDEKEYVCIFAPIFEEVIKGNKGQRQGLIKSLLSLFTTGNKETSSTFNRSKGRGGTSASTNSDQDYYDRLPLLSYAAQILAHLPYTMYSDPLLIIHYITGTTALQGAELLDKLRSFLLQFGLAHSEEDDIDHSIPDPIEVAQQKGMRSKEWKYVESIMIGQSQAQDQAEFDMETFRKMCIDASALILLLRLRIFIKREYNLSDTRCIEYNPSDKTKGVDKNDRIIFHQGVTSLFDNSIQDIDGTLPDQKGGESDKTGAPAQDVLVRKYRHVECTIKQYAEFRVLMRRQQSNTSSASSRSSDGSGSDSGEMDSDSE